MQNNIEEIDKEIADLETEMQGFDFWDNKGLAQEKVKLLKDLKLKKEGDDVILRGGATLSIVSGAGGDDSEDWARMLFEMYTKFILHSGFNYTVLHSHTNEHGGYKNISIEISGKNVYGNLKNESGVHRLVRISPFNANDKRHTSFALVEVLPIIPDSLKIEMSSSDLDISFAKSSGPGGQNVNKRETAVRISHIPSGISVHVSEERSQEANKQKALDLLYSKLYALEKEKKEIEDGKKVNHDISRGEIEWGNQIRNYVMHPYKLVKDVPTGVETTDIESVLGGDISIFIEAFKI